MTIHRKPTEDHVKLATEIANIFGGNGLSTNQQIELVAKRLVEVAPILELDPTVVSVPTGHNYFSVAPTPKVDSDVDKRETL